jgi:hypothetical protein
MPGLDHSKFVVITNCERTDEHDDSYLKFAHAADVEGSNSLILDGGGTRVPDINEPGNIQLGYLSHPHVVQHCGNLPIPEDEADNYNDAIDSGRSVVAYPIDGGAQAAIEAAFRGAGLAHVKSF